MSKKRYTLYISRPPARKFDLVAQQRQGAKSARVEEALRVSLEPQPHPGLDDGLALFPVVVGINGYLGKTRNSAARLCRGRRQALRKD